MPKKTVAFTSGLEAYKNSKITKTAIVSKVKELRSKMTLLDSLKDAIEQITRNRT